MKTEKESMTENKHAVNRRKKLLINPDFQVKFIKNLLFLNVAVCTIFYLGHAYFFWEGRELGRSINLPMDHVFFRFLDEQQRTMNVISVATMTLVSGLIIAFGLVYSHRIAGPIYRLQKYLRAKSDGTEKGQLFFRQHDYFKEIADSVNDYTNSNSRANPASQSHKSSRKKAA